MTANHAEAGRAGDESARSAPDEPGAVEFLPSRAMQVVTNAIEQIVAAADDLIIEHPPGAHAGHDLGSRLAYVMLEWLREYPS